MARTPTYAERCNPALREKPPYHMPEVAIGDLVMWHPDQDAAPDCVAIVTAVNNETVDISCFAHNFFNMNPKDGVRHVDHPDRTVVAATESGVWSVHPRTQNLLERLGALERRADSAERKASPEPRVLDVVK